MQAPDLAVKELRRCVQDLGLAGVQIGSHVNDWNLNREEIFPIFEVCLSTQVSQLLMCSITGG